MLEISKALECSDNKVKEAIGVLMHVLMDDNYTDKERHEIHAETARRIRRRERIYGLNAKLAKKKIRTTT
jgi:hypothetical protein